MPEEYKPTKKEIAKEMASGARDFLRPSRIMERTPERSQVRDTLARTGRDIGEFSSYFFQIAGLIMVAPYIIPTAVRSLWEIIDEPVGDYSVAQNMGGNVGAWTGIVLDVGQVGGYVYAAREGHPEALLIPVATNTASGVYELGRMGWNNARQRLLDRHGSGGLEAAV